MPDLRRLFTLAKVLTCSCFSSRKPTKTQRYQADNVRAPPGQEVQNRSAPCQHYGISPSSFDVLPDPDNFEIVDEDENSTAGTAEKEKESKEKAKVT
ncbi:hypothetical protein HYE67_003908 [Fusarium culmorum]|uniref:Uncharacterized protein n=1 Tax=Fusarium culmorum TaxID=5516 RepID=A0A2T4GMR7_FUSCU|nr:hypothetical protein FCULG_00001079 [Fusarium culmorum]QPC61677.1 hypothetical protein HYE67_003908 [Fusarium culmorum]